MRIAFLLPIYAIHPIGGIKIVLEYACRLTDHCFDVTVYYPMNVYSNKVTRWKYLKRLLGYLYLKITQGYKSTKWFPLNRKVKEKLVWDLNQKRIATHDIYVATGVQTAYSLSEYKYIDLHKQIYLIQGFENWIATDEYVLKSYRFPFKKIVISPWLQSLVLSQSTKENVVLIPNGFNQEVFNIQKEIFERNIYSICTIYHTDDVKRCVDAISALIKLKELFPQITVNMFGVPGRPPALPDWIKYYQKPNQDELSKIYNDSSIYLAASRSEGMALPPAEAMLCGCALVCTNIGGFALYAINNETSLTSEPYDVNGLVSSVSSLLLNPEKLYRIALAGNEKIKTFTWENSVKQFIQVVFSK